MFIHCFCVLVVKMEDLDLPEIKRRKIQEKKAEDKKEFKDLFQSDSDSDDEDGDGLKIKGEPMLAFTRDEGVFNYAPECCDVLASRGQSLVASWPPFRTVESHLCHL